MDRLQLIVTYPLFFVEYDIIKVLFSMGKGGLRGRLDVSIHKSARAFRVILLAG